MIKIMTITTMDDNEDDDDDDSDYNNDSCAVGSEHLFRGQ